MSLISSTLPLQQEEESKTDTTSTCPNCGLLRTKLQQSDQRYRELEEVNEGLRTEVTLLLQQSTSGKGMMSFEPEIDLKKSILSSMTSQGEESTSGLNLKKIQQELRVSKKAEQLAKEKLTQTKRMLEKIEKDFAKYREDSENRVDTLKNELAIMQKHYDQLQNSASDMDSALSEKLFGGSEKVIHQSKDQQTAQDLMKIIDEQSKQIDIKSRDLESLTNKLDKKRAKLIDSLSKQADSEARVQKLKSTLDNVKTFLKLLNTNFIKSMKQQNASLKKHIGNSDRDIQNQIDTFKVALGPQISKVLAKKERELLNQVKTETQRSQELQATVISLKSDHEQLVSKLRQDHTQALQVQKDQLKQKITNLKDQMKLQSDQVASKDESKDALHNKLAALQKDKEVLAVQFEAEKEKHQLVVNDLNQEVQSKSNIIEELRTKEKDMTAKFDENEQRYRDEISKLYDKLEKVSNSTSAQADQLMIQQSSQRDLQSANERHMKDLKELYDSKLSQQAQELDKLLQANTDLEATVSLKTNKINQLELQSSDFATQTSYLKSEIKLLNDENVRLTSIQTQLEAQITNLTDSNLQFEATSKDLEKQLDLLKLQYSQTQELLTKELQESKQEVARLIQVNIATDMFKAELEDEVVSVVRKAKSKKAKKSKIMSQEIASLELELAEESVVAPPIQQIESEEQVIQVLQQSRASSSSGSSSRELHFEGGQEEKKEVQAQPITQAPMHQAPFRPPMNRPPAPMGGGMGRGRGAPQFRPPFGNAQPRPRPNIPQFGGPRMQPPPVAQFEEQPRQIQEVQQEEQKFEQPATVIQQQQIIQQVEAPLPPKKEDDPKPVESEPIKQNKPQEEIKEEPIASKKPEEEIKSSAVNTQASAGQSLIDFKNNRFFGMINGFISILTRRKRAYTGRASSATYYDEKKKRYVFEGEEDESDDDVPPPPPPKRQPVEETKAGDKPAENAAPKEESALESLIRPAFSGALAARGRGMGRGAPINRFPQLLNPSQLSTSNYVPRIEEKEKRPSLSMMDPSRFQDAPKETNLNETAVQQQQEQENQEMDDRYVTGIDLTVNQTRFELANNTIINQTVIMAEHQEIVSPTFNESELIQQSIPTQHIDLDPQRESQWLAKFHLQQDKITNLKYRVQMLQLELRSERDQNEQTIESFTLMCQDLKFKGMDEVEDLQSELAIESEQMRALSHIRASKEIQIEQLSEQVRYQEEENQGMREQIREMRFLKIQEEIDREIEKIAQGGNLQESEEHESELEQEVNGLKQVVLGQQIDLDNYKWRVTVLEADKLSKVLDCRDLQSLLDRTQAQLTFSESETHRLQEDLRRMHQEQVQNGQEQMAKVERERDQLREVLMKTQQERDRLNDTLREKVQEFEMKTKRQESDRQRIDLDHSRQIREKDSQVEFLKTQILSHQHQHSQHQEESKHLHSQLRDLQAKLQQLHNKRQSESEQQEHILKLQLKQTQEMLESRNQEALKKKEEEMSMELQQMDAMRHKLTENIVYLQNEIRKRDDLLENSSEFGGDFEMIGDEYDDESSMNGGVNEDGGMEGGSHQNDSQRDNSQKQADASQRQGSFQIVKKNTNKRRTQYQALQSQLEDTRVQLKREIEQRLTSERLLQNVQHSLRKVMEGVFDINKVIDSQHQQFLSEQAEPDFDGDEQSKQLLDQDDSDIHIQAIISKIFALQRGYETELSECKHRIMMQQMKLEEFDSLKFDLEILQDEKSLLETDLSEVNEHAKDLESMLQQAQTQAYEQQNEALNMREKLEMSERTRETQRQQYEDQANNMKNETQRQIDEIHERFEQQKIPAVKQKYQARLEELQEQINSMRDQLTSQLEDEKRHSQELERQNMNLLSYTQAQLEQNSSETQRLRDQLRLQEQETTNVQEQLAQLQLTSHQHLEEQSTEINSLRQEIDDLQSQHKQETDKLVSDFDQVCAKLKERYEQKSLKVKESKDKMRVALEMMREQCTQESQEKIEEMQRELDRVREPQASAVDNKEALDELEGQIRDRDEQIKVLKGELEGAEPLKQQVEQLNLHNAELQSQYQQSQIQEELQAKLGELSAENERLAQENQQLHDIIESLNGDVSRLQSDLDSAQQKNEKVNLEDIQPNFDQRELESTIATLREELLAVTQSYEALKTDSAQTTSDLQSRLDSLTTEKDQQLQHTIDNYTQREEQFKSQTKEIVRELKEKIKKEKEVGQSKVSEVRNELAKCQADKKDLEGKILELKNLYNQALLNQDQTEVIQGLQNQNEDLSKQVQDLQTQTADLNVKLQQALSNLSVVEDQLVPLQSQRDSLLDQLDQLQRSFDTLVDQLAEILGIEEYGEPCEIIDKLQLLMQNYEEDKRSLKVMIDEKEHLAQLSEQYYQEKESVIIEKTSLQNKFEASNAGKIEKKLRTLEEENSVMKSDFYIRINSFVEEIDQLKSRLSQYEVVVENPNEESKEEPTSFTSDKPVDYTMTQAPAERPSFAESQIHKPADTSNIQQRSGIFNSIASFFLTESEMHHEGQQK